MSRETRFLKMLQAGEPTQRIAGFLLAWVLASAATWGSLHSLHAADAVVASSFTAAGPFAAGTTLAPPATLTDSQRVTFDAADSKLSVVVMDGLAPAEDESEGVLRELAELPGGKLVIKHMGPIVPPELQVFMRLLRHLNKEREKNPTEGRNPFKIEFEWQRTPDTEAYADSPEAMELREDFAREIEESGWVFRYKKDLDQRGIPTDGLFATMKNQLVGSWKSAGAWINHIFGMHKKGITWIDYKAKRDKLEANVEKGTLAFRLTAVSIFMAYAMNAKNDGGANLNIVLPIVANILMSIGFDINLKGNRSHKAQGKTYNPETKKYEDNKKGYLLICFLHTLLARQVFAFFMHLHPFAKNWYDMLTLSFTDIWTGLKASITGQPVRVPVDIAFRQSEKKRHKAWENALKAEGLTEKEIESRDPPFNWRYALHTALWGVVIAGMQVNKQVLDIAGTQGTSTKLFGWFDLAWIDSTFNALGYLGALFMLAENRASIWRTAQAGWDRVKGSQRNCQTLLRVESEN